MSVTDISEARPSSKRSDAARANGAKSRGPITPEGKAASARNGIRHALAIRSIVLPWESDPEAAALLEELVDKYQPADPVERRMVEMLATHQWQQYRAVSIQQGLFKNAAARSRAAFDKEFGEADQDSRNAESFRLIAEDKAFTTTMRYANGARLAYAAKLKELLAAQSARHASAEIQTEPKPAEPEQEPKAPPQTGDRFPGTSRNAPCPCHSGEKYKRCCGRQAPPIVSDAA